MPFQVYDPVIVTGSHPVDVYLSHPYNRVNISQSWLHREGITHPSTLESYYYWLAKCQDAEGHY